MAILRGHAYRSGPTLYLADHTYVTSSDGYAWGCWGGSIGGNQICQGNGNSAVAACLSQPNSHAGITYLITGVCHQTANRILYPAMVIVSGARGYWLSSLLYGTYGRGAHQWIQRIAACNANVGRGHDCESEIEYVKKVGDLYAEEKDDLSTHFKELVLTMEFRLKRSLSSEEKVGIKNWHTAYWVKKDKIDDRFINKELDIDRYIEEIDSLFTDVIEKYAKLMKDDFEKIVGLKYEEAKKCKIIDPDIVMKVYKNGSAAAA